ncbi:alpha/beta hydrolase family protein [Corynebacterium cystitidis]|uniref:alpha/beta hydrolase family protein n=2 Tax=Corynebacterium cystitidis TaxID=35757 RepID=UPI00211F2426|nr:alpha/beta hydrolase family protein [Corynebacterium cystitidis]
MASLPPQRYGAAADTLCDLQEQARDHVETVRDVLEVLASTEFSGEAADAGRARFEGLSTTASRIAADAAPGVGVLRAAELMEQVSRRLIDAIFPFTRAAYPTCVAAAGTIHAIELDRLALSYAVAAALRGTNASVQEPELDRLYNNPDLSFDQLHARHMATVPADIAEVVDKFDGVILEAGEGGIAVLVGDAQRAPESVMTLVAGKGSSASSGLENYLERGATMAQRTGTPTVVWLGYTAPDTFVEAAGQRHSQAAGDDLADFQAALHQRFPNATHTVVAHSYGTVVVGEAAATHGLYADNVVLLGSPGVPVAHVDQMKLHSDNPHVLVADTINDPIEYTRGSVAAWHGANPRNPFFGAEVITLDSWGMHSGHWNNEGLWERVRELNRR